MKGDFTDFQKTKLLLIFYIGLLTIAASGVGWANGFGSSGRDTVPDKSIEEVLKKHTPELMALPGVVGTAQGLCDHKPCIKVYVIQKTPELDRKIPEVIEGYSVEVEETGEIRALPKNR